MRATIAMLIAHKLNRLRSIVTLTRVLPRPNCSGSLMMLRSEEFSTSLFHQWPRIVSNCALAMIDNVRRYSAALEMPNDVHSGKGALDFFRLRFDQLEGHSHRWLNCNHDITQFLYQERLFLVLFHEAAEDILLLSPRDLSVIFKKIKLLQQRYPDLNVFGVRSSISVDSVADHGRIIQTIMEEFVIFPILLLQKELMKDLYELKGGGCFMLFEGSSDHLLQLDLNTDMQIIVEAIEEFRMLKKDVPPSAEDVCLGRTGKSDILKEPYACPFRNLFLYYPGCLSVDEDGNRIFISDSNHHRIIISDHEGKILDCIGSSPGFEDGEFQYAKLLRPAASFFCPIENCLYFVDSENHAIRKADLEKRVVETLVPTCIKKSGGIWNWILDKLGFTSKVVEKSEELDPDLIKFPWHLIRTEDNDLLIIDRSFEVSWVISMKTGETKKNVRGISSILELYGHVIMEKVTLLEDTSRNYLLDRFDNCLTATDMIPYAGFLSSLANFCDDTIFCDAAGQCVLKCHKATRTISRLNFSNMGVLGLPYWMACPLERVFSSEPSGKNVNEHFHHFSVLPGRSNIQVFIDIPKYSELLEPLEEGCIWRQVRGSGAAIYEGIIDGKEKVGVAQQWFDELDNLAFSQDTEEADYQVEQPQDQKVDDKDKVHFDCSVNISPGTCEVVISAVLYLKLKKTADVVEDPSSAIMKILDNQPLVKRTPHEDASIKFFLDTFKDVGNMVFMKPLNIRLRLQCADHPPAETNKETIFTDTAINLSLSLE